MIKSISYIFNIYSLRDGLLKIILANVLIILLLTPTLEQFEASSLFYHMMIEHLLFIFSGYVFISGFDSIISSFKQFNSQHSRKIIKYYSRFLALNNRFNPYGIVTTALFLITIFYWHVPSNFDIATADPNFHILMHMSLIISGTLIFCSFKMISNTQSIFLILSLDKIMGILGFFLAGGNSIIYNTYLLSDQITSGFWMIVMMMGIDAICISFLILIYFRSMP
mgnify:CR=1 FL=1